jgi:hypothetical protein
VSAFLESLLARSFGPSPPAIRPRPVARFEQAEGDVFHEEESESDGSASAPATRDRLDRIETIHLEPQGYVDRAETSADLPQRAADVGADESRDRSDRELREVRARETRVVEREVRREQIVERTFERANEARAPGHETPAPVRAAAAAPPPHRVVTQRSIETPPRTPERSEAVPSREMDIQVEVTIGRIELGAPRPIPPPRPRPAPLKPAVTLDDYLRRRDGGGR